MEDIDKRRWKVRGAVLAIFLLGFVAGLLALNVYNNWLGGETRQTSRRDRIEQTFKQLNLTDEQQSDVRTIFNDTRSQLQEMRKENAERRSELRRKTDEGLQKVLTPSQWQQFQEVRSQSQDSRRNDRESRRE
jgi:Spy/CpxP family protein refolding chaperone